MRAITILGALLLLFWFASAHGMSGSPDLVCDDGERVGSRWIQRCEVNKDKYLPPGAVGPHPIAAHFAAEEDQQVVVNLPGWSSRPKHCETPDTANATSDEFVVDVCSSHYPDFNGPPGLMGRGTWKNQNHLNRVNLAVDNALSSILVDPQRGVHCRGQSYGAARCLAWAMRTDRPIVSTQLIIPALPYHRQAEVDPGTAKAWGDYDRRKVHMPSLVSSGQMDSIYFRVTGSPADNVGSGVGFSTDFFRDCDEYKIACFGTWHAAGHSPTEPGISLPFLDLFASPHQELRLDKMLPIFTGSTANHWGAERGHYNLGLSWHAGGYMIDSAEGILLPLRYLRHTGIGGGVPDQPASATFDLTIRRVSKFDLPVGRRVHWKIGDQTGTATVAKGGEVTIQGITLASSNDYTGLLITPIQKEDQPDRLWPIVMTLSQRSTEPVGTVKDASPWDKRYDVSDPYIFTPGDSIVIDDLQGNLTYVHDCRGKLCAATDAKVSPDGKRLLYQVMWGDNWEAINIPGATLQKHHMHADYTDIWQYEIATGKRTQLTDNQADGVSDMHPHWRSDDSFVMVSNREKLWANWAPAGSAHPVNPSNAYNHHSLQLHMVELNGTSINRVVNWRPHALMDMNPWVVSNGDTCLTAWEGPDPRRYGTPVNATWIECVNYWGGDEHVELGAHTGGGGTNFSIHSLIDDWAIKNVEGQDELRAIRPVVEITNGWLNVTNYYRRNMMGCGINYTWEYSPGQPEGSCLRSSIPAATQYGDSDQACSGRYVPPSIYPLTPFGHAQDSSDIRRTKIWSLPAGRACEVAPHPDGGYLLTVMRGGAPVFWPAEQYSDAFMKGEPLAKLEVRYVPPGPDGGIAPVNNPFNKNQSDCIAGCDLDVHASKPQVIAPYQAIYGQPAPTPMPEISGSDTKIQIVDVRSAQLKAIPGKTDEKSRVTFQGNAHPAYTTLVTEFCVQYVELWDGKPTRTGYKSLGEEVCKKPHDDGSLEMDIKPDQPFLHFAKGVVVHQGPVEIVAASEKTDSLRPGETRVCHGCHDGHDSDQPYTKMPAERFAETDAHRAMLGGE